MAASVKPDFDDFAAFLIDGYPQYSLTATGAVWFTDLLTDPKWLKLAHAICEQHGIDFEPVLDKAEALRERREAIAASATVLGTKESQATPGGSWCSPFARYDADPWTTKPLLVPNRANLQT